VNPNGNSGSPTWTQSPRSDPPSWSPATRKPNGNDPKIIAESQQYLRDFSRLAAEETTSAGIVARMADLYPGWENLRTLWHSARTAIARKNG
jgi:hypothetical protein